MVQIAKTVPIQWLATWLPTGNSSKSQLIISYKNLERMNANQETPVKSDFTKNYPQSLPDDKWLRFAFGDGG
jgi:hypothetical protein